MMTPSGLVRGPIDTLKEVTLQWGYPPQDWKEAVVTKHKAGSSSELGNLGSASLIRATCKVLEGIVKEYVSLPEASFLVKLHSIKVCETNAHPNKPPLVLGQSNLGNKSKYTGRSIFRLRYGISPE